MTLQLKTKKEVVETTEIELPAFFKMGNFYVGIFDTDDVVKFYKGHNMQSVERETADFINSLEGYSQIEEQDFRIEYMKHMEKFALPKHQITTDELIGII